jgi:uncharacterized protein HemY
MDLMKSLVVVFIIFSFNAHSIIPNNKYHESTAKQVAQLNSELKSVESSLQLNPSNETTLKLKSNLIQQIKLIKQKVKLYQKLEKSGLIMYSKSQGLVPKTPNKPLKQDK